MNIPHNIEAERALLHQLIFEAIESIHREGRNPDMISVSEWLASAEDIIASTTEKLEKIASSKTLSPTTTLKWELALQYYPDSKSKKAATDRLKYAIDHCRELKQLISLGPKNRKAFCPYQEELILEYLGEP